MTRRFSILWLLLIALILASAASVTGVLAGLPELPFTLGPDLRVRNVRAALEPQGDVLGVKHDDRLVALKGRPTEDLYDVRYALELLGAEAANEEASGAGVTYQFVRPLHRFSLQLRGEALDPTELPPGVEEGDKLVELDGRPMKPKVGTEGLRSIISSRPEALLVLERRDALFGGVMRLVPQQWPTGVLICFGLALVFTLVVWRLLHPSLSKWTGVAIAAETTAFAWCSLLVFQYQWLIADSLLAMATVTAMILARPLGIFARSASAEDAGPRQWGALALGALAAVFVMGALALGKLPNAELALQFAAVLGGLFVIFEVVLTGLNEGSGMLLGERSIYLAGLVVFIFFACLVAYSIDPVAFAEERWRWFGVLILALVWFGDVLLCFRGLPATPFVEIATKAARHERVMASLEEIAELYPAIRPTLVLVHDEDVYTFSVQEDRLVIKSAPDKLSDAVAILIQEDAQVPLPYGVEKQDSPMAGIAEAMEIAVAMRVMPPNQALRAADIEVVLIGYVAREEEPVSLEELDFLQQRINAPTWTAAVIEVLEELVEVLEQRRVERAVIAARAPEEDQGGESAPDGEADEQRDEQIAALQAEVQELHAEQKLLRRDRLELAQQVQSLRRWHAPAPPLPGNFESLLEEQLLDAILYLCDDPAPVVLAGPSGAGKTFTACAGHLLEGRAPKPCILYDAATYPPEEHAVHLYGAPSEPVEQEGDEPAPPPPQEGVVLDACGKGSLIIERAQWLAPEALVGLLDAAVAREVRVYLCYDAADAQQTTVLAGLPDEVREVLDPREVVLPPFAQRTAIQREVVLHCLEEAAWQHGRDIRDVSPAAMKALLGHAWPGNIDEVEMALELAVMASDGDFLELGDLPMDVRRSSY